MNRQPIIHPMKIKSILTLLLTLGFCAGVVEAKGFNHSKHHRDTDHNGTLSLDEFTAGRKHPAKAKARFERADRNRDGQLDRSERASLGKHKHHRSGKGKHAKKS